MWTSTKNHEICYDTKSDAEYFCIKSDFVEDITWAKFHSSSSVQEDYIFKAESWGTDYVDEYKES